MKPLHERDEISVEEAASLLEVSRRSVQRACKAGRFPAKRQLVKIWCIDLNALRERYPEEWARLAQKHAAKIRGVCVVCGK